MMTAVLLQMRLSYYITFVAICFLLWPFDAPAHSNRIYQFPGKISQAKSPNNRYMLLNIDSESEEHALLLGGNHALYLRDLINGDQKKFYSYDRHIEILWSPRGSRLFINDYAGSDYSNAIIFSFDDNQEPIDIKSKMKEQLRNNEILFGNHHVYISATEWIDENSVKIKVSGYGDVSPKGFMILYGYTIGGHFKKLN